MRYGTCVMSMAARVRDVYGNLQVGRVYIVFTVHIKIMLEFFIHVNTTCDGKIFFLYI